MVSRPEKEGPGAGGDRAEYKAVLSKLDFNIPRSALNCQSITEVLSAEQLMEKVTELALEMGPQPDCPSGVPQELHVLRMATEIILRVGDQVLARLREEERLRRRGEQDRDDDCREEES